MTFTDAAREVLTQVGRPLHYKEITELAIEKNLLSHVGKSPEVTMGARLAATLKKSGDQSPLVRVKPGVFALSDWDEETIKMGLQIKRAPRKKKAEAKPAADAPAKEAKEAKPKAKAKAAEAEAEAEAPAAAAAEEAPAEEVKPAKPSTSTRADVEIDATPQSPDEEMRAEIAAKARAVFAAEDDDDQPILKGPEPEASEGDGSGEGRRRRRRRRRRGGRSGGADGDAAPPAGLPSYTAKPAFDGEGGRPQVIEVANAEVPALDGLAGQGMADAVAIILGTFDRTVGAVSLRQITETAQRRGKLSGEPQLVQSQIAAAVRADNVRREVAGVRPRFRLAGGRVGLTDWMMDGELLRLEQAATAALQRYRDGALRSFARRASELPGHAFVELCLLLLERAGVQGLKSVRFPGASGSETHFSGVLHAPAGAEPGQVGAGDGTHLGIVVRRDGRDVGRERVTELRGACHHYDGATAGWIFTAGKVLSGAREEARAEGAMPVTVLDGLAIARLASSQGVAVTQTTFALPVPDIDLFEALRSS